MKKITSLLLIFVLVFSNVISFAGVKTTQQEVSITLLSNNTYYRNDNLQGEIKYLIDGDVYVYKIKSNDNESVVDIVSNKSGKKETIIYDKKDSIVTHNEKIIAYVDEETKVVQKMTRSAGDWSDSPFYGSSSDYGHVSTSKGTIRFGEAIEAAVISASTGTLTSLLVGAFIASTGIQLVTAAGVSALIAIATYQPGEAAYYTKYKYAHDLHGYYKYITMFYYDSSRTYYADKDVVYYTTW